MNETNFLNRAKQIFAAAVASVQPQPLLRARVQWQEPLLTICDRTIDTQTVGRIYLIGAGKASAAMAATLEEILGDRIEAGLVIVKDGHGAPCRRVEIREAGHPVVDGRALAATDELLALTRQFRQNDLVICLISGGGSALLEKLPPGVTLADLQETFRQLLGCGASIDEMNAVRKHLSLVKGGQLARAIHPARCLSLILSDVIGDSPETIASGPTAPDGTTFDDAWEVLEKYRLTTALPHSVIRHLSEGRGGLRPETPRPGDPAFDRVENLIVGNNFIALQAAEARAASLGLHPLILTTRLQGEAREAARVIVSVMAEVAATAHPIAAPACLLFGGETTVTLRGNGTGGRNQEFALAALIDMAALPDNCLLLSCGTDGTDGPTDAAGAFATPEMYRKALARGLSPAAYLENNNAYPFFEQTGGLIKTGPTGTNVMDIGIGLIG